MLKLILAASLFFLPKYALAEAKAPVLIGGAPADVRQFPASVRIFSAGGSCTATLVGDKVVLSAAHCMTDSGVVRFAVGANTFSGRCTHSPDYARNKTADWALCKLNRVVPNVPYEHVLSDPRRLRLGQVVTLTGYGCTQSADGEGAGGNDGTYRVGAAPIIKLPRGSSNDIVTRGRSAICFGDSGGPAFLIEGKSRIQIAVNSRANIEDTSYLSSLAGTQGQRFLTAWATANSLKICGVSAGARGCRRNQ